MKPKFASKNTTKIEDLKAELRLPENEFTQVLRDVNIRLVDRQKNLDQNEVGRIRKFLNDKKRKSELQRQKISLPPINKVTDFARALELPVGEILGVLLKNGVMATLNDNIDYDTAAIIAEDLGYKTVESVALMEEDVLTPEKLEEILKKDRKQDQVKRPPVVTIMGHVDHGKTTLLDTIRKTNVAKGEAGGITQAISSYQVERNGRLITFIDTPGHETFEFMRKRGVSLADVAILVVAADDGVKPQTIEAVKHARAAKVPIVVAINKIDKAGANIDKVKAELAERLDLNPEEWGGKTIMTPVSALKGDGINDLLEMILLTADLNPPMANPKRAALASVIESNLDNNLGPIAAVLVHTGTLLTGDDIVIGRASGRVRRLMDWSGKTIKEVPPGMPATIVGLDGVPEAGEILQVVEAKGRARQKALHSRAPVKTLRSTDENDDRQTLALVLKADSGGSLEAMQATISAMVPDTVRLSIIRSEVGAVSDSDVLTAAAGTAIIYAFNITTGGMAKKLADKEGVPIRSYEVIYELIDDVRKEITNRLPVDIVRTELGTLKVLKVFFATPKKKIVGGDVANGTVEVNAHAVIWRKTTGEREEIGKAIITDMQRERTAITQAQQGDQIGLTLEGKGKIKAGDIIEIYKEEKVRRENNVDSTHK